MKIEILGTGCRKCKKLTQNAEAAAAPGDEVVKVTDLTQIMTYGVVSTPALVIDGEVKSVGKLLSADDIRALL